MSDGMRMQATILINTGVEALNSIGMIVGMGASAAMMAYTAKRAADTSE